MAKSTNAKELALACAQAAEDMKAENIQILDVRGLSSITDYIILCSTNSAPHLRAILRDVEKLVDEKINVQPVYAEGNADSLWVVLDYIDVMVHVMDQELREFYALEELWPSAKKVPFESAVH